MSDLDTRAAEAITRAVESVSRRRLATTSRIADHLDIRPAAALKLLRDAEDRGLVVFTLEAWELS